MKNSPVYENEVARIWLENGVMCCAFKVDHLTLDTARQCVNLRLEAADKKDFLTYIDMTKLKSVDKEARDHMSSEEGTKYVKASALLTNSLVGKFMANFFLQVNKPRIPTRLFTNEGDAFEWLKKFEKS